MGKTILVVEDDAVSRKLVRDVLRANGYEVAEAETGEAGLAIAREAAIDLVVMDVQLPGMDGLEAIRRLRAAAATAAVPVVAVTAHAMPGDEDRILASGCDRYMAKPLRFGEFVATVRELLDEAAA